MINRQNIIDTVQDWYNDQLAMLLVFDHWHPAVKRILIQDGLKQRNQGK